MSSGQPARLIWVPGRSTESHRGAASPSPLQQGSILWGSFWTRDKTTLPFFALRSYNLREVVLDQPCSWGGLRLQQQHGWTWGGNSAWVNTTPTTKHDFMDHKASGNKPGRWSWSQEVNKNPLHYLFASGDSSCCLGSVLVQLFWVKAAVQSDTVLIASCTGLLCESVML